MVPVAPGKKSTGIKTANNTKVVASTAPKRSSMVALAAARAPRPEAFLVAVVSMIVIASSTTSPVASTRPKRVSWLRVKPNTNTPKKEPTRATGIAIAGTRVAFQSCRKRNSTSTTRITASRRAEETPSIEARTKSVLSMIFCIVMPTGMVAVNSLSTSSTPRDTSRALLPVRW